MLLIIAYTQIIGMFISIVIVLYIGRKDVAIFWDYVAIFLLSIIWLPILITVGWLITVIGTLEWIKSKPVKTEL